MVKRVYPDPAYFGTSWTKMRNYEYDDDRVKAPYTADVVMREYGSDIECLYLEFECDNEFNFEGGFITKHENNGSCTFEFQTEEDLEKFIDFVLDKMKEPCLGPEPFIDSLRTNDGREWLGKWYLTLIEE